MAPTSRSSRRVPQITAVRAESCCATTFLTLEYPEMLEEIFLNIFLRGSFLLFSIARIASWASEGDMNLRKSSAGGQILLYSNTARLKTSEGLYNLC